MGICLAMYTVYILSSSSPLSSLFYHIIFLSIPSSSSITSFSPRKTSCACMSHSPCWKYPYDGD